jgi:hypothetical protein
MAMTGTDVLRLLDQGYTKAEIELMRVAEDEAERKVQKEEVKEPDQQNDEVKESDQQNDEDLIIENKEVSAIEAIAALNKTVEQLTVTVEAMQKNNIAGAKMEVPPVVSIDEVLTQFISNM